jgi:hypothetical protein
MKPLELHDLATLPRDAFREHIERIYRECGPPPPPILAQATAALREQFRAEFRRALSGAQPDA